MKSLILSLMILFSIGPCISFAEEFSGFTKYIKFHVDYEVNPDGTYVETNEIVQAVLTEEGIEYANQVNLSYSESLEKIEIISAHTIKKDGTRIEVPVKNIQEREAIAGGGPAYSDIKTKVIIFPDVAAGDKVAYSYKHIQKTPLFPGHFSMMYAFDKFSAYDEVRITLSSPVDSIKLYVFASGVEGGFTKRKEGRINWAWTFTNGNIVLPESGAVDPLDYGPRIIVSSFKEYSEVAANYDMRAREKAFPTEKIRKLAAEITNGIVDKREQVRALYNWVSLNIHYAGNCIGLGSVVPHDAELVLSNKLGDCKDHTALLQALLAAKGIESTPALVNYGDIYKLPEVASPFVFNHVINYIPSLDLYADATAKFTPLGLLPVGESDKPVVHTATYTGIKRTPSTDYNRTNSYMNLTLNINEDGSAEGFIKNKATGSFSVGIRSGMAAMPPNVRDIFVKTILSNSGFTGTGTFTNDDPRSLKDEYSFGMEYKIDNAISLPGPGAMHIFSPLPSGGPISSVLGDLNFPGRTLDFGCFGGTSIEEFTFNMPRNVKIISIPRDTSISTGKINFDSSYKLNGNSIKVIRKLEDRTSVNLCTPKDDRDFKPIGRAILKDLKSQIIYEINQ